MEVERKDLDDIEGTKSGTLETPQGRSLVPLHEVPTSYTTRSGRLS